MNEIQNYNKNIFESIKHIDEEGNEYWYARELQDVLEYKEWRYFSSVIERAQVACIQSKNNITNHFGVYTKMVDIGSKTSRMVVDYKLSRYACYLIVQNSNSKYKNVALGQTYLLFKQESKNYLKIH